MESAELTEKVDKEVKMLQEKLKVRLQEAQDLGDLSQKVQKTTFTLEKHTAQLSEDATKTKWLTLLEYYKLILILCAILGLFLLMLLR